MSTPTSEQQQTVTISVADLEAIIQRTVRETVREELRRLFYQNLPAIRHYLLHEGPDDPEGDEQLLQEALETLEYINAHPESVQSWEEFEAELDRAEAAGELPA
jgi:tRNA A37 threonylcarbamoyladenosine dehydratase